MIKLFKNKLEWQSICPVIHHGLDNQDTSHWKATPITSQQFLYWKGKCFQRYLLLFFSLSHYLSLFLDNLGLETTRCP